MTINGGDQPSSGWGPTPWTLILPIAALMGVALVLVVGAIWFAVDRIDDTAKRGSSRLAVTAVETIADEMAKWAKDHAYWDATIENVITAPNAEWADDNLGQYFFDTHQASATIVIGSDDRILLAVTDEEREALSGSSYRSIVDDLSVAVERARTAPMEEPEGVFCVVNTPHGVAVAGLSAITPETPTVESLVPAPRPVLIFLRPLDERWVTEAGRRFQLPNLRVTSDLSAISSHAVTLFRSDDAPVGAVDWDAPSPGLGAFWDVVLPAAVMLLIVLVIMSVIVRRVMGAQRTLYTRATELSDANTKLVETSQQVRSALQRAEHATRTKSAFLARVSHEIRTPLTAIIGFSQILKLQHQPNKEKSREQEYAEIIHESSQHLLALVNDLLDLSKIESGGFELNEAWIDLRREIATMRTVLLAEADRKGIALLVEMGDDVPALYGDSKAVRQILTNLVTNALKFTGRGGRVTVTVRVTGNGDLRIDVEDTGSGIPAEDLEGIWEPFKRARNPTLAKAEGTGLGLHLVKVLCDMHDAEIDLRSEVGKGTRVTVIFGTDRVRSVAA